MNSSIIDNFHCAVVAMSITLHKNIVLLGSQVKSISNWACENRACGHMIFAYFFNELITKILWQ